MPSIILSDNGVSSGSAGLKSTAASDGVLVLQTTTSGGTATNAVYVDTSQNVGIGGTPSYKLDVTSGSTNTLRLKGSGSLSLYSYHDSSGVGFSNAAPYSGGALLYFYSGQTELYSNGTAVFRVTSGNSISLEGATPKAGTGITFPASQSASSDANTLDDYEEGTWTVTATPSTSGSITLSSSVNTGSYTKVGRMVSVMAGLNVSSVSSPVGKISLNLPFPPANGSQRDGWGAPSIMINNATSAGLSTFVALLEQGSNVIGIYLGTGTSVSATSAQQMNSSTEIFFTLTYKT